MSIKSANGISSMLIWDGYQPNFNLLQKEVGFSPVNNLENEEPRQPEFLPCGFFGCHRQQESRL